jgi:hypothetical protein
VDGGFLRGRDGSEGHGGGRSDEYELLGEHLVKVEIELVSGCAVDGRVN